MMSAAPLSFVCPPSLHCRNVVRKSDAILTAVDLALLLEKHCITLAEEKKMATYKQFGFVSLTLPCYWSVISDLPGTDSGEWSLVLASQTAKRTVMKRLYPKEKLYSLHRELVSRFSQPRDLVADLFRRHLLIASGVLHSSPPPGLLGKRARSEALPSGERSSAQTVCRTCSRCCHGRQLQRKGG